MPKNIGKNMPIKGVGSTDEYLGKGRGLMKSSKGWKYGGFLRITGVLSMSSSTVSFSSSATLSSNLSFNLFLSFSVSSAGIQPYMKKQNLVSKVELRVFSRDNLSFIHSSALLYIGSHLLATISNSLSIASIPVDVSIIFLFKALIFSVKERPSIERGKLNSGTFSSFRSLLTFSDLSFIVIINPARVPFDVSAVTTLLSSSVNLRMSSLR